jgi:hypothetical protein
MNWTIEFYNKTVETCIKEWPDGMMPQFLWLLNLIEIVGPDRIDMPYVQDLGQRLFKITIKNQNEVAYALFCISRKNKLVIILDGFIETTAQAEVDKIALARIHILKLI